MPGEYERTPPCSSSNASQLNSEHTQKWEHVYSLKPKAALEHCCMNGADPGQSVHPRSDYSKAPRFLLDFPLPKILDMRSWQCRQCSKNFRVMDEDITRTFPKALRCSTPKQKDVWFTELFLIQIVLKFFELLNVRATRRYILEPRQEWTAILRKNATRYKYNMSIKTGKKVLFFDLQVSAHPVRTSMLQTLWP